ncbi:MAG TPA: succinate dehydrogenase, cytochrome b556 subunit [Anaerolineales bacterium]|nr:succinate dehydrogenase, cytochrome b556 subunit [Anaerolineales bacterium]
MSTLMSSLQTTLKGYATYRGREGHFSFVLHRLTGLGTLLFLIIHILDTSTVYFIPDLYQHAIALYRSTPFMLGEIALVFSVIFHGVNGLRIAYLDMRKPTGWQIESQRKSARATLVISIILWLPAAGLMGYHLLHNNFGMFN